jgi:hypothetical protein
MQKEGVFFIFTHGWFCAVSVYEKQGDKKETAELVNFHVEGKNLGIFKSVD